MSRYAAMFERLGDDGAFGAFLMLGDPDLETSARLLDAVVEGGAVGWYDCEPYCCTNLRDPGRRALCQRVPQPA